MKKNAMRKNLRQSIVKSFGRYAAISGIIALGAGLFSGLLMTKVDMIATGQQFVDRQNMFDIRFLSSYGWSPGYVDRFAQLELVEDAEGMQDLDVIARTGEEEERVYRLHSLPERINQVSLRAGRMPEAPDECLEDFYREGESRIGQKVRISSGNSEDTLDSLNYTEFTIVGSVATPLYMDMNRGTTSVGSGVIESYYYVPGEAFNMDYYTEIHVTLSQKGGIYTKGYQDALDGAVDVLEPQAEQLSQQRFEDVKAEAETEYRKGYESYQDGIREYQEGRAKAEQELRDARKELEDGEQELADSRQKLIDADREIKNGREQIELARSQISDGRAQIAAGRQQLDSQHAQLEGPYQQAQQTKPTLDNAIREIQTQIDGLDPEADQELLSQLQAKLEGLEQKLQQVNTVIAAMDAVQAGYQTLNSKAAEIEAAEIEMWKQETKLNQAYESTQIGWGELKKGQQEIADGWIEYEDAKKDVAQELKDAEEELKDAEIELQEGREEIDSLEPATLYVLDRTSNVGYNNLDSSSDIVSGVSRVFPVFFLLVASLVCITTMTRMIDEERTQIGTLKALGYTNREIVAKYLFYSGSGAILGCGIGIWAGCTVFPQVIWQAYCIMLHIQPDVVLTTNWPLWIAIVTVYTGVMLFVTWYCCKRTLLEEPAQLIRPKAPEAGKKILLEYLPFWGKVGFLNKVTLRNIFRYRQRLAMMLVGIGGCTALLLTGFGLRDSIVNVVDFQFENITLSDLSVYFREGITEEDREEFARTVQDTQDFMFFHQSSVEVDFGNRTKEIYLISGGDHLTSFLDLHAGTAPVALPGPAEAVLSVGVAENMGIQTGDTIVLRKSQMEMMELTVSGIYDNHIYNYVLVSPETIEEAWKEAPEEQMAYVRVAPGQDIHAIGAQISALDSVMSVSVSEDLAFMVRNMMEALDLVILVIVFCAGLLAVIVLYNLTNININERIREIATIKVLGFNASETSAYVFKENLILTLIGSGVGLVFGKLLLLFVMSQIKIDMIWFQTTVKPMSYVFAFLLTLLSAVVVDFIFYFKLDRINMAEALKSVE